MTRKAATKKKAKKPAKAKPVKVYIAVRELASENDSYTEPDRVFASKGAAQKHAEQLNRELRTLVNPFANDTEPDWLMSGGEKAFLALLKKLKAPIPKKTSGPYGYIEWDKWWDSRYFDMTDAQRDAIWDALDRFNWYKVKQTTLED